jgi:anti-sigma regulatory factor (Ser/Thr protein kinase)
MPADERRRTSTEVERSFPAELEAPGEARRFVAEILDEVGATNRTDDVEVLVSELATNAVVHTQAAFKVGVSVDERLVRLWVSDRSQILPTRSTRAVSPQGSGRGLELVDAMADHWGIEMTPEGKVVWVELNRRV